MMSTLLVAMVFCVLQCVGSQPPPPAPPPNELTGQLGTSLPLPGPPPKEFAGNAGSSTGFEIVNTYDLQNALDKFDISERELKDMIRRVAKGEYPTMTKTVKNKETGLEETFTLDFKTLSEVKHTSSNQNQNEVEQSLPSDLTSLRQLEQNAISDLRALIQSKFPIDEDLNAGRISDIEHAKRISSIEFQQGKIRKRLEQIQNAIREYQRLSLESVSQRLRTGAAARRNKIQTVSSKPVILSDTTTGTKRTDTEKNIIALEGEIESLRQKNVNILSQIASARGTNRASAGNIVALENGQQNVVQGRPQRPTTYGSLLEELYTLQSRKREIERILQYNNRILQNTPGFQRDVRETPSAARQEVQRIVSARPDFPSQSSDVALGPKDPIITNDINIPVIPGQYLGSDVTGSEYIGQNTPKIRTSRDPNILYADGDIIISKIMPADESVESGFSSSTSGLLPPYRLGTI